MWSTNCVRHSFRGYVQNILAPEFVWIRITWDASQAATVDRGSGRKLMQNHREVSRWSGDPDLQSHFAFLSMQIHPIRKAVRHQMIKVIKSLNQIIKVILSRVSSPRLVPRSSRTWDVSILIGIKPSRSQRLYNTQSIGLFAVKHVPSVWISGRGEKTGKVAQNSWTHCLSFCFVIGFPTVSETSQWKVKTRNWIDWTQQRPGPHSPLLFSTACQPVTQHPPVKEPFEAKSGLSQLDLVQTNPDANLFRPVKDWHRVYQTQACLNQGRTS